MNRENFISKASRLASVRVDFPRGSSYIYEDVFSLNLQGIDSHNSERTVRTLAGFGVKLPSMPGANNPALFHDTLTQWPAAMEAQVVECGKLAIHIGDAHHLAFRLEFFCFALKGQICPISNSDQRHEGIVNRY